MPTGFSSKKKKKKSTVSTILLVDACANFWQTLPGICFGKVQSKLKGTMPILEKAKTIYLPIRKDW